MHNRYIGLLSGTSIDAIDAGLFDFANGIETIATLSYPIPPVLRDKLIHLSEHNQTTLAEFGEIDHILGRLFAESALAVLDKAKLSPQDIQAIGSHGQTLWHQPSGIHRFTIQAGDANLIAKMTQIQTISDFRRGDMALGGQGAPLVPAFHHYLFASDDVQRVIVNIGGISNITYLPSSKKQHLLGYDTGPGNGLIDDWCRIHLKKPYDHDGQWAKSGIVQKSLLEPMLNDPYFKLRPPKSTGKDYFNLNWLKSHIKQDYRPQDVQATLVDLTASTIAREILRHLEKGQVIICGGGAHNTYLTNRIKSYLSTKISMSTSEGFGLSPDWVEAACFAWLAKQRIENQSCELTTVTGATNNTVLGALYLP